MKKYDGLYIFAGMVKEEGIAQLTEKATAEITRLDGKVLDTVALGKKSFAHPMDKKESGYYVKVRFEMDADKIATLVNRYHLSEDVFRVQILAVDERREEVLAEQARIRKAREEAREAARAEAEREAAEKAAFSGEEQA